MFIGLFIIIIYSIFLSYIFKKTTAETLFMSVAGTKYIYNRSNHIINIGSYCIIIYFL